MKRDYNGIRPDRTKELCSRSLVKGFTFKLTAPYIHAMLLAPRRFQHTKLFNNPDKI